QRALGAAVELLDPDALRARFPWLNTDGLAGGGFGPRNEGWIDPHALLNALRRKAIALGVRYIVDELINVERIDQRIVAVALRHGGRVRCGTLINAAGANAGALARLAGVMLP